MTMAVCKLGDPTDPWGHHAKDDLESLFGSDEELFNRIDLLGFELDDVDPSVFDSSYDSEDDSDGECLTSKKFRESRNHDCMWGGQCCNKEFQRTTVGPVPKPQPPPPAPAVKAPVPTPSVLITHSANKVVTIVPASEKEVMVRTQKPESRSLLLNRTTVPSPPKVATPNTNTHTSPVKREPREQPQQNSRPDTPQSEDDDLTPIPIDPHNTTSVFRSALEAITTPRAWEETEVAPRVQGATSQTEMWRLSATTESDHNYDGSKNIKLEGLGVVTPSDSEEDEEIDVVSLSERSSSSSRSSSCGGGLPTRPTQRDQRHLEEITTSLLSASEAVSRKLKASHQVVRHHHQHKRKKYCSESSDSDSDDSQSMVYKYRQTKRQKSTPTRRKKNMRFGEEEDSQEKRDLHNNMERMRRIDLRNSFEELKALVPCLSGKERAAKVVILREAASYCCDLGAESQSKCMQVMALRKEQERLRAMVSSLRKARAAATIKNR